MKKILLLALIASSAVFAGESAAEMMKDAAAADAKTEVVAEVQEMSTEANVSGEVVEEAVEKSVEVRQQ